MLQHWTFSAISCLPSKAPCTHSPAAECRLPPFPQIYPLYLPREVRTRRALLICNIDFEHLSRRDGAEVDVQGMTKLLEGLGYVVDIHLNLSSEVKGCTKQLPLAPEVAQGPSLGVLVLGDSGTWWQWLLPAAGGWLS